MNVISELETVLREEQELLLKGDFIRLEALIDRKARLSDMLALEKPDVPAQTLRCLAARAQQNEELLESARRGLQAAMHQLRQPKQSPEQTTYSKSGQRNTLSKAPASVTQKI